MLVASLDPEIYLKSERTQRRLIAAVTEAIRDTLSDTVTVERLPGHRLALPDTEPEATERLSRVFGIRSVDTVDVFAVESLEQIATAIAEASAAEVNGHTFAVRPHRVGSHDWSSQDLAVLSGSMLVDAGGRVDLTNPEITVRARIIGDTAYLTRSQLRGVGGLPPGSQGNALMLFSGGIDSPVAAFMMSHRGIALDYLHFSLGCGQADHAAGIAHLLYERYGAGTDPTLHVVELEPVIDQVQRIAPARERQMALKGVMYLAGAAVARFDRDTRAMITGEAIGQVSTQTLANITTLDRLSDVPVLRPLLGLDKDTIIEKARTIGTLEVSSRTRETCDISSGAKVSVATSLGKLNSVLDDLRGHVDHAVTTAESMRLADWTPGA